MLTNHSAKKTLVKRLEQNHLPHQEINGITGQNNEAGLGTYHSGDEEDQRYREFSIKQYIHFFKNTTFSFFDQNITGSSTSYVNIQNCTVNFHLKTFHNHPNPTMNYFFELGAP